MGCTNSKLDNEDTVRRCKQRHRLIKQVVDARNHLAAAHSDYCHSLRLTGSSLSSFAAGEHISVSDTTPPPLHFRNNAASSLSRSSTIPPPPEFFPATVPMFNPTSSSSSSVNLGKMHLRQQQQQQQQERDRERNRHNRRYKTLKVPHILSESSIDSTPRSYHHPSHKAKAAYSSTHSQASSVWNWENFYPPPSPPDSEYFQKKRDEINEMRNPFYKSSSSNHHADDENTEEDDEAEETGREEVHCSEWGDRDHYSTTSSSDADDDDDARNKSKPEIGTGSLARQAPVKESLAHQPNMYLAMSKYDHFEDPGHSISYCGGDVGDMRIVVRHKDLAEIVSAIKESFDNAAIAGEQISETLETGRAQLDGSFRHMKKTVYHSNGVLSNLSSNWTSKPPLAVKYRLDTGLLNEQSGPRSLCSTLERLLAWEKKLYQEVKAREGVKIEHEKKLSMLQSQEYKRGDEAKMDRTKASIQRLQSLIIVTSQAVSTTSDAITAIRDGDLVPQLAELCHGFMYMWRSMNQYHEVQNQIVQQVRGLVCPTANGDSTSDLHRQATRDLESAVSLWHSSFCRLIKYQRDFILSLHGWLKLTLLPVKNENNSLKTAEPSELFTFCDEWKLALDRLPDTVASEAIKSFVNVVHVISMKQTEELKVKRRAETVSKELEKKSSSLRHIQRKYYQSYSTVGIALPHTRSEDGHVIDSRDPLCEKKSELAACQRRVEDEQLRLRKAVEVTRAMTLNNIQTGLPGVFQAMSSFSGVFTEALEVVCKKSYAIN